MSGSDGNREVEVLIAEYEQQATVWARPQVEPERFPDETPAANEAFDRTGVVARKLMSTELGRAALLELLDSENIGVRYLAASDALLIAPERAVSVLESLAQESKGLVGMGAEYTVLEWRQGTLKHRLHAPEE